jgi:predicted oxidoreductase
VYFSVFVMNTIPELPLFSALISGAWRIPTESADSSVKTVRSVIDACLEHGITTFDHADIYGDYQAESIFGAALKDCPDLRRSMRLVTKCGIKLVSPSRPMNLRKMYDTSYDHIIQSVETSLTNLRTDHLDVLLIHRPDPLLHAEEVARAFSDLRTSGKVLHFGVSNFTCPQFALLQSALSVPMVTNQVEFSPLQLSPLYNGVFDDCLRLKVTPTVWSPFAGGKLFRDSSERAAIIRTAITEVGVATSLTPEQVALAWIRSLPCRPIPIIGTQDAKRIPMLARAAQLTLDREQWFRIFEAALGHPVP